MTTHSVVRLRSGQQKRHLSMRQLQECFVSEKQASNATTVVVAIKRSHPPIAAAGEVTLTGRVLPIGGVKEKTLAARRSGVKTLVFPAGNKRDYDELSGAPMAIELMLFGRERRAD